MPIRGLKGGMLKFLSEDDLKAIHIATVEILSEIGVKMEYEPALEIFKDFGAKVDFKNKVVKIGEDLLRKGLASAPSTFTLYGKTEDTDIKVDPQRVYTIGGSSALNVFDLDGEYRPAVFDDLIKFTILLNQMENLHIMHAIVIPSDIEEYGVDRLLFAGTFPYTTRNYYSQSQTGADGVIEQLKMAAVFQGSEDAVRKNPMFTEVVCMVSPLKHEKVNSEVIIECAKNNIPVYVEVDAMPGGTTPAPIAGCLVEQNANVLAGIVLAQLVKPGTPCIYSIASGLMDMTSGGYSGAAPETNLLHCCTAQVAHFYNLPFQGGTGIDAKISDAQAGYERAMQVLSNALAGTNFVHLSFGMMEMMMLASYEQVVIDNEIMGATYRMLKGVEVNDFALSVDLLRKTGHGGHFLNYKETSEYVRKNNWIPKLTNRDPWNTWQMMGSKSMNELAREEAARILKENTEPVISREQTEEILKMAKSYHKQAQERLKKQEGK
ncbi:MAG: trimethylamine methyltransferase family protein [Actinobacteria bacterium]|nr:trimethylamine methyltransferase family protein [Cyanobacteriota bacterium]MCL5771498.1 trimethylamine methyltransferase family protein [Actinomycetota bacterium]